MTSPPPAAVDELQGHLDAVAVGLVEDELAVPLQGLGGGIQRTRVGRVRDLLDADDDVHGGQSVLIAGGSGQIGAGASVPSPLTVRLLLVVNSSASSVTARGRVVITKALSADHDVTVAETTRRGHATRLAQGAAADGVDVVVVFGGDGTLNEAANGLAGTRHRAGRASGWLDQRLRPHPRTPRRPHRGHRRAPRRPRPRVGASGRAGLGERPLLPLPRRDRLRRRGRERGRAPGIVEAVGQPRRCSAGLRSTPGCAATTVTGPTSACRCPGPTPSTTGSSPCASTPIPTRSSARDRSRSLPRPPSTGPWPS